METKFYQVKGNKEDASVLVEAAQLLQADELVAFPTETVYGLGANAFSGKAVQKIFVAKGRPQDNPLIVHIATLEQLKDLVREIPSVGNKLMTEFWPGPLTLVFPKDKAVPDEVTAGLDTVAVRMPSHPLAQQLLKKAGLPIAAPSANLSGRPSPTTGKHVWQDLQGKIPLILEDGSVEIGLESTVVDVSREQPVLLRPGSITREDLEKIVGKLADPGMVEHSPPPAPGMKYRHYAPQSKVEIFAAEDLPALFKRYENLKGKEAKIGVLLSEETDRSLAWPEKPYYYKILGSRNEIKQVARQIFAVFRECDDLGVTHILLEAFPRTGIGEAVDNRVRKAASAGAEKQEKRDKAVDQ